MTDANEPRTVRFGVFEADLRAGELRKNGVKIKLQEQPFQVLVTLLKHAGEVVTREELRRELWPTDTFVDFDHSLNAAVKRLRDALGESAENPIFVETLARRGYRLNAPVDRGPASPKAQPPSLPAPITRALRWPHLLGLAGIAVVLLALIAALTWAWNNRGRIETGKAIESVAVLPLENLSHDPEQEYFSDGMTDALTAQLTKTGGLRVISRTSAVRYKGTHKSLPEIAVELNVDGVIEGSVMRSGNRVRVVVQLIRARTDQQLWAETYERDLSDVLRLQSDVALAVAQQVRTKVTPAQQSRLRSSSVVVPEAYEAYLKGRQYEPLGTQAAIKQAQAYFEEAVQRDPGFALAYVGLADCYQQLGSFRWLPPREAYRRSSEAINTALKLDETLGEAHSTLGYLAWQFGWDWQNAERELRYAVELNPNYVGAHETVAWYLAWRGQRDEALAELATIRRLDPAYPLIFLDEAGVYYHARDFKSLIEAGKKSVDADPHNWTAHYFLAVGYEGSGHRAQSIPEYQQAIALSQRNSDAIAGLAHLYATTGKTAEAEEIVAELQRESKVSYVSPYMIAVIYSGLGESGKAFEFLEKAYQERSPDLAYFVKADLRIDALRSDERFRDLWRRIGVSQ